jgi:hypothetical protein
MDKGDGEVRRQGGGWVTRRFDEVNRRRHLDDDRRRVR